MYKVHSIYGVAGNPVLEATFTTKQKVVSYLTRLLSDLEKKDIDCDLTVTDPSGQKYFVLTARRWEK